MCRILGVSASGYYQWCHRAPSLWARTNERLIVHIRTIHSDSHETYGSPRVAAQLRRDGFRVGTRRVARLMRQQGLRGNRRRKFKKTTLSDHGRPVAPNHLMRQFHVNQPNRVWPPISRTSRPGRAFWTWPW
jgi:putative transposase